MTTLRSFCFVLLALSTTSALAAKNDRVTYSLLAGSLAPNAGGQIAPSLRRATDDHELSVFANTALYAGAFPLMGAAYLWRWPICGQSCFWQIYAQAGGGLTTAGPMAEIAWGTIPFWVLRVDIATQIIFVRWRAITWSYPLWVGLSLPLW